MIEVNTKIIELDGANTVVPDYLDIPNVSFSATYNEDSSRAYITKYDGEEV